MDLKMRILQCAERMIFKRGVRAVTLDEMAIENGISKKTIYQFFKDKEELIKAIIKMEIDEDCKMLLKSKSEIDPIEGWFLHLKRMKNDLEKINPTTISDIKKFYPQVFQLVDDFKKNFLSDFIKARIEEGVKQELFKENYYRDEFVQLFLHSFEMPLNEDLFPRDQFEPKKVIMNLNLLLLEGMLTPKGQALFEKYKPIYL